MPGSARKTIQQPVQQPAKPTAQRIMPGFAKKPVQQSVQQPVKPAAQRIMPGFARKSAQQPVQQSVQQSPQQSTQRIMPGFARKSVQQSVQQPEQALEFDFSRSMEYSGSVNQSQMMQFSMADFQGESSDFLAPEQGYDYSHVEFNDEYDDVPTLEQDMNQGFKSQPYD